MKPPTDVSNVVRMLGVSATVVLAAACASSAPKAGPSSSSTAPASASPSPSTSVPRPLGPFSGRIELLSPTLVAGTTERGILVLDNETGAPLRLTTGGALPCKPGWTVILTSEQLPQEAAFPDSCDSRPMVVHAGETRLPFTLLSDYQACSETGRSHGALTPPCVKDANGRDTAPPLPPGDYRATFFSNIAGFIPVESVPVRVVRAA